MTEAELVQFPAAAAKGQPYGGGNRNGGELQARRSAEERLNFGTAFR